MVLCARALGPGELTGVRHWSGVSLEDAHSSALFLSPSFRILHNKASHSCLRVSHVIDVHIRSVLLTLATRFRLESFDSTFHNTSNTIISDIKMFSKTILLSALSALAAAQSAVLTFTNVPNPITDGQAQAITYATNDTTSVSILYDTATQ